MLQHQTNSVRALLAAGVVAASLACSSPQSQDTSAQSLSVVSYAVAQRTRELGIRVALGASAHDVVRLVVREGMTPVGIGVLVGLMAALAATRVMQSLLYGIRPTDPLTLLTVTVVLAAIAFLASWIPARRATRVDPMVALRSE